MIKDTYFRYVIGKAYFRFCFVLRIYCYTSNPSEQEVALIKVCSNKGFSNLELGLGSLGRGDLGDIWGQKSEICQFQGK